jgi:hypothetical protein
MASPSSSPACSIRTFWKTTSPAGKDRRDNCLFCRASRAGRYARFHAAATLGPQPPPLARSRVRIDKPARNVTAASYVQFESK